MTHPNEDPLVTNSRREAVIALSAWVIAMIYVVGYSYRYGYDRDIASLKFVFGFPDWVFYGIVLPWLACTAFGIWFSFRIMKDDPLGEEQEPGSRPVEYTSHGPE